MVHLREIPVNNTLTHSYPGALIAGVDEAGRGPLAGSVVAAAVILNAANPVMGLDDSKKLTPQKRLRLFHLIRERATAWSIANASVAEIDSLNILQASLLAMKRAVESLTVQPGHVLVDGNKIPHWDYSAEAIVKGDSRVAAIAAASILAKVTRDGEMEQYATQYPGYGFAQHKGYPTRQHREAIKRLGVSPIHRRSYGPVSECINMAGRYIAK